MILYHGTSSLNIKSILKKGFQSNLDSPYEKYVFFADTLKEAKT